MSELREILDEIQGVINKYDELEDSCLEEMSWLLDYEHTEIKKSRRTKNRRLRARTETQLEIVEPLLKSMRVIADRLTDYAIINEPNRAQIKAIMNAAFYREQVGEPAE